ncbi:glycosyltransferase family 2 protein [Prolixibacteraceae bacterium JC049]|nr:glycosyltransferase family 2 protein [Prolixibacteraceae bacterium JC049]
MERCMFFRKLIISKSVTMNITPEISIVIVNYNCWRTLKATLSSIEDNIDASHETIVVDNCSPDNQLSHFKMLFPNVTFLQSSVNGGFAYACNVGADYAKGENILFLNPDTELKPNTLGRLLMAVKESGKKGIFTTNVVNATGKALKSHGQFLRLHTMNGFFRSISNIFNSSKKETEEAAVKKVDWVTGAVLFMSKSIYKEIKGWDEDYFLYHEDTDVCKKAADRGYGSYLLKNITIEHQHGVASKGCITTKAMAKTEVIISRHVYAQKHLRGIERILAHTFMITHDFVRQVIHTIASLFLPKKLELNALRLLRLVEYYAQTISYGTWQSSNTVSFEKKFGGSTSAPPKIKRAKQ